MTDTGLKVTPNTDFPGTTHILVRPNGRIVARLYSTGSPAWRSDEDEAATRHAAVLGSVLGEG